MTISKKEIDAREVLESEIKRLQDLLLRDFAALTATPVRDVIRIGICAYELHETAIRLGTALNLREGLGVEAVPVEPAPQPTLEQTALMTKQRGLGRQHPTPLELLARVEVSGIMGSGLTDGDIDTRTGPNAATSVATSRAQQMLYPGTENKK